tara:strand:- start:485 stop:1900 length:1416 start_codon:yes stop_codon:yes gene_type:complete
MNRTIIQETTLDYDINLVSMTKDQEVDNITPLTLNGINYLEIADTLPNVGLDGVASINNDHQILDKIGITKLANKTLHLTFNITDVDLFKNTKDKQRSNINFNALLETNTDLGSNIATKSSIFKFEESLSARLKKSSAYDLLNGSSQYGSSIPGPKLIQDILTDWALASNIDPQIFLDGSLFVGSGDDVLITNIWQIEDSVYDLVYKIHNSFTYGSISQPLPPLFRFKNISDKSDKNLRKLTLEPIISDRGREFINAYTQNKIGNYTDIYQEEFIITGEDDASGNSSLHNKVEEYSLIKPDYKTLRREVWGKNLFVDSGSVNEPADLTSTSHQFTTHSDYIRDFNTGLLGGLDSNVPLIPVAEQKVYTHLIDGSDPSDEKLLKSSVLNKVLKSFIYLNEAIVISVKGQIYRKPGRFITIIDGNGAINDINDKATNLWYITEVKHVIKQGLYTNKITAVRILGKTPIPSIDV